MMRTVGYRKEIDGLRAIAIVSVVLFHAWGQMFPGGYIGVDIFFVISGYLITSIIFEAAERRRFSYKDFYARRARRILPALLAMALFTSIAAFAVLLPDDLVEYGKTLIYTLLFGANFKLAAARGYFDQAMQENPLLHMWSLSVEEQFYLAWPAILIIAVRFVGTRWVKVIALLLFIASLSAAEALVHIWPKSAFFHLPTRGWELLSGALLALNAVPPITNRKLAEVLSALGIALMIAPIFYYTKDTAIPGVAALLPVMGCVLVLHANTGNSTKTGTLLSWEPIVFIGLISYSLYLWHWPILAFAMYVRARPLDPLEIAVCVLIALFLSILSWRFIEQPFRKKSSRLASYPKVVFAPALAPAGYAAFGLTVLLVGAGSIFQETKGAPWRFSSEARNFLKGHDRAELDCLTIGRKSKRMRDCQFGNNSSGLVLWGDSHAEGFLPIAARTYGGGHAYFNIGCTPLANSQFVAAFGEGDMQLCGANNDRILREVLQLKPKIVIMVSRWTRIEHLAANQVHKPRLDQVIDLTLKALTSAGIKVILARQVPEMQLLTVPCILRAKVFGLATCDNFVSREDAERSQNFITQSLSAAASKNPGVFLFRPFPHLCDSARCYAMRGGTMLYYDDNHLSAEGASSLFLPFSQGLPEEYRIPPVKMAGARD